MRSHWRSSIPVNGWFCEGHGKEVSWRCDAVIGRRPKAAISQSAWALFIKVRCANSRLRLFALLCLPQLRDHPRPIRQTVPGLRRSRATDPLRRQRDELLSPLPNRRPHPRRPLALATAQKRLAAELGRALSWCRSPGRAIRLGGPPSCFLTLPAGERPPPVA
jgi:hypothetical protein